jgi:hypothetical protein
MPANARHMTVHRLKLSNFHAEVPVIAQSDDGRRDMRVKEKIAAFGIMARFWWLGTAGCCAFCSWRW